MVLYKLLLSQEKNAKALFSNLKSFNYFLPFPLELQGQLALLKAFPQVVLPDK